MNTQCLIAGACVAVYAVSGANFFSSAYAEEGTILDTLIISTTRAEEELRETPNAVSVISGDEIEESNFVDSEGELLSRIPGNSMSRNLRIPIGGKNYTANLVDGLAVRGLGRGTNSFIDESNTMDIERVEVIKGPASSLYGSNAIGGVINVITRMPPEEFEARVWGDGGSWGRKRGGVQAAGPIAEDLGYFFDANIGARDGWQDRSGFERKRVSGKLVYQYGEESSISIRGEYLDLYEENPGDLTQKQYDEDWRQAEMYDAFEDQKLASFSANWEHNFSDKSTFEVAYGLRKSKEDGPPSYSARGNFGKYRSLAQNVVPQYQQDFDFFDAQVIAGLDFLHDDRTDKTLTSRDISSDVDDDLDSLGVQTSPFGQLVFWPTEWMKVSLGTRYDMVDISLDGTYDIDTSDEAKYSRERGFSNLSKNAGVTFNLNEDNSLWLGYGEGFVVPGSGQLWTGGRGILPNPDLEAEKAVNYAIGARGSLLEGMFSYDVSIYNTTIKDMIVADNNSELLLNNTDPDITGAYGNAGETNFSGLEASLSLQPLDWLGFGAAYTHARNKYIDYVTGTDDKSGNYLRRSPLHHLNARVILTPTQIEGLKVELEWDYISDYYTDDDNDLDPLGTYQRPSLLHLRASYETERYKLWGGIKNLTDVKYGRRASYTPESINYRTGEKTPGYREFSSGAEPLTVSAGLTWKFGGN